MMNRCSAPDTRMNLNAANALAKSGIDFVCVPVSCSNSKEQLIKIATQSLEVLALSVEVEELKASKGTKS